MTPEDWVKSVSLDANPVGQVAVGEGVIGVGNGVGGVGADVGGVGGDVGASVGVAVGWTMAAGQVWHAF